MIRVFLALVFAMPSAWGGGKSIDPVTPFCTDARLRIAEICLPNMFLREMSLIPSKEGMDATTFLRQHPNLPFRFAFLDRARAEILGRKVIKEGAMMSYSPVEHSISIAHFLFHEGGGNEERFIQDRETQRRLAEAVAVSLVHEISHARTEEEYRGHAPLLEDEYAAYYRNSLFLLDVLKARPDFNHYAELCMADRKLVDFSRKLKLFESNRNRARADPGREKAALQKEYKTILSETISLTTTERESFVEQLNKLAVSNFKLEEWIRAQYPDIASVFADPEPEARKWEKELASARREYAAAARNYDEYERLVGAPHERKQDTLDGWARLCVQYEGVIEFLRDTVKMDKLRKHFSAQLSELRAEMDRRRVAGELEGWDCYGGLPAVPRTVVKHNLPGGNSPTKPLKLKKTRPDFHSR